MQSVKYVKCFLSVRTFRPNNSVSCSVFIMWAVKFSGFDELFSNQVKLFMLNNFTKNYR